MPQRPLIIDVEHAGRSFAFQVHARELEFGRAGKGHYFWMDGRQFRQGSAGPNFRLCVDLWWHVVTNAGQDRNPSNEMTRVFAECYPLVNTAKAVQDIYTDAHLHRHADREYTVESVGEVRGHRSERMYLLPDEEVSRIQRIAHQRNAELIRAELEQLFLGPLPSPEEMPAFRKAAQAWIGTGIEALHSGAPEKLRRYTNTVDEWVRKLRCRAGLNRERMFLNMFSYECKAAFYFCYAQAWIGIFQTLQRSGQLDAIGERFMRLWHHQNQAAAEGQRDVLCGQILALHPLSGVVHGSPQHLAVIGEYLALPEWESVSASGKLAETKEYWDVIATILVAAHEYEHSRTRWEEQRGQATRSNSDAEARHVRDDATDSPRIWFEDYAAERGRVCPHCFGALSYERHEVVGPDEPLNVIAIFRCQTCARETSIVVNHEENADSE